MLTINQTAVPDKRSRPTKNSSTQPQTVEQELLIEEREGEDDIAEFDEVGFEDSMDFSQDDRGTHEQDTEMVVGSNRVRDVVKEMIWGDDFDEMLET